jgi:hypothetical protein
VKFPFYITAAPAVTADGTIYLPSHNNGLSAIQGASPLAASSWPTFRHDSRNTGKASK